MDSPVMDKEYGSDGSNYSFRALVVDDEAIMRFLHRLALSRPEIEVQLAKNGQEAVNLHHAGAKFELILMDREMPVMDGLEATMALRIMGIDSVILGLISPDDTDAEREAFMEAGLDACFVKPINEETLAPYLPLPPSPAPTSSDDDDDDDNDDDDDDDDDDDGGQKEC